MPSIQTVTLSENGSQMRDDHSAMSARAFQTSTLELGEVLEAYRLAIEIITSAATRTEVSQNRGNPDVSRVEGILSGFIVGLTLVEYAILGGFTAQGAALVRQELEAIAALEEIKAGRRVDGKTPNIGRVPSIPGHIYADLSALTHFSRSSALGLVAKDREEYAGAPWNAERWLLSPQHVPNTTKQLFGLHTVLCLHLAQYQLTHYASLESVGPPDSESLYFQQAIKILEQSGVIESGA